jgi:hypothetical protein
MAVQIVAAMVNPPGPSPESESALNTSPNTYRYRRRGWATHADFVD